MAKLYLLNGPEMGKSFGLKDSVTLVGRSMENDIRIDDKTVSRKHLRILKREDKFFVKDLNSQNGTFVNGQNIATGVETEAKEGQPIAIGMSLICLGKGCIEQMMPLLESVGLTKQTGEQSGIFLIHKDKTNQKKMELLHRVAEVLTSSLPMNEALQKILDYVFDLLKTINRAAFILVDPETDKILDVISKLKTGDEDSMLYSPNVVRRVIKDKKPLVVSNVQTEGQDGLIDTLKILKIESVMCVPLVSGSKIMGVIYLDSQDKPFKFAKEDLSLFVDVCKRTATTLDQARFAFDSTTIADNFPSGA